MSEHSASKSSATIALLLPLSGRMSDAGDAIRDGFLAALLSLPAAERPSVRVYDASLDAAAQYRKALEDGASCVVGPLGKESVAAVRALADGKVPVLALNHLSDGQPVPPRFYQFALAPEDEASQIGEAALAAGLRTGALLVPSGDWGQRVRQAFVAAFGAGGGRLIASETYPADTTDFSELLVPLLGFEDSQKRQHAVATLVGTPLIFTPRRRDDLEFIFFAGQAMYARLVRPQLRFHFAGDLPVYAPSDVHDPLAKSNQDLDGITFTDIPWLVGDEDSLRSLRATVAETWPSRHYEGSRLFAMGHDAARLIEHLHEAGDQPVVDGLTGRLRVAADGRVRRTLRWATFAGEGAVRALPAISVRSDESSR